jgi:tetratricopeptide (TPR) repeat protein/CHAT domain-containing protein
MRSPMATLVICLYVGSVGTGCIQQDLDSLNTHVSELYDKGDYAGAMKVAEQAVTLAERRFGKDAAETATPLSNLALVYASQDRSAEAEPLYRRALAISEQALGPDHPDTAIKVGNLAALFTSQDKHVEAEAYYRRALAIFEKALGPDHPDTVQTLNNLAVVYIEEAKSAEAEPLLKQVLANREKSLGPDHPDTATVCNNLASLFDSQGKYAEAEPLFRRALAIRQKALGPDHPDTASSFSNLASHFQSQRKYAEAEPLFTRAIQIAEKSLGPEHSAAALNLNNLALLYESQGQYTQAEPLYIRALAIREKVFGPDHPETARSLNNLAKLYESQGRYAEAAPLFNRALTIILNSLGPDHPDTAVGLNNIACLYMSQGQYAKAEPLCMRSLAIREKSLGPDHPDTATSLNNLASLCEWQGKYAEAKSLCTQALAIREKALGPDHPLTADSLNNLASLYESKGKYAEAESLYMRSLAIREKAIGPDHPDTGTILNNLALLYHQQGRYAEAEPLYMRSLAIREKALGPDHPDTATSLDNLARMEAAIDRFSVAAGLEDRARRGRRRHVARVLPSLSAAEQALCLRTNYEACFHCPLTLALLQKDTPPIALLSAGWVANGKAVAQEALSQQILLSRESDSKEMTSRKGSLASVRSDLGRLSQAMPSPEQATEYRVKIVSLQQEERRLISEIGGQIAMLSREEPWIEIDAVRAMIPVASVLIDIARFDILDFKARPTEKQWLPARYAAWIVPPENAGDITIVDLGDAAEIDNLVADYRRSIESREPEIPAAKELAARVLQPILAALPSGGGKIDELILSPDGALWLVPWQALPLEDGRYAVERYTIRTVISGRSLVPPPPSAKPSGETTAPLVMADPDFESPPPAGEAKSSSGVTGRFLEPVEPLPNTKTEAEAARGPLGSLAGVEPVVKLGRDATETELKSLAVRTKVLVLATHGFFLPDQEIAPDDRLALGNSRRVSITRPVDKSGKAFVDPLLRCGLLLAGANVTLSGQQTGSDDGILTGAEIVGLDLLGTDLVVLSACETGIGDVRNGEGVAGLRQAFQIAGVPTVVSTLWRVPDAESAAIMTDFYQHLAAGKSASVALREAQLGFIAASRKDAGEKAVSPYLWAAYGVTGR